ncbi:hypothetical protein HDV63DRAFT_416388, partial [Trichoderma sp. SZMC 28014]
LLHLCLSLLVLNLVVSSEPLGSLTHCLRRHNIQTFNVVLPSISKMADNEANAAPAENEESDSAAPPAEITPDRLDAAPPAEITSDSLDQVSYDPDYALNTFLNSDRPMETLEARIDRIQARLQEFDTKLGSRKEQNHPK